jgi:hypothetical protein
VHASENASAFESIERGCEVLYLMPLGFQSSVTSFSDCGTRFQLNQHFLEKKNIDHIRAAPSVIAVIRRRFVSHLQLLTFRRIHLTTVLTLNVESGLADGPLGCCVL